MTNTPMNQPQTTILSALVRSTIAVKITVVTTAITNVDEVTIRAKSAGGVCMLRWGMNPFQNCTSRLMPRLLAKKPSAISLTRNAVSAARNAARTIGNQLTSSMGAARPGAPGRRSSRCSIENGIVLSSSVRPGLA